MSDTIRDGSSLTPGQLLAAAREARSLTQEDIAKRTRLAVHLVDDLEHNEYSHIGARTFVRGYLCTYARLVGIPEKDVLEALESSGLMPEVPDLVAPVRIEGKPVVETPVDRSLPSISFASFSKWIWSGAAVAVVIAGVFVFQNNKGDLLKKVEAKTTKAVANTTSPALAFVTQPAAQTSENRNAAATPQPVKPVAMNGDNAAVQQSSAVAQTNMPAASSASTVAPAANAVQPPKPVFKRIKHHSVENSFTVSNDNSGLHPTYVVSPVDVKTEQ